MTPSKEPIETRYKQLLETFAELISVYDTPGSVRDQAVKQARWILAYEDGISKDSLADAPVEPVKEERNFDIDVLLGWIQHSKDNDFLQDQMTQFVKEHQFEKASEIRDLKKANWNILQKLDKTVLELFDKYDFNKFQNPPAKEGKDIPEFLKGVPTEKDIAWAKEVIRKYEAGEYKIAQPVLPENIPSGQMKWSDEDMAKAFVQGWHYPGSSTKDVKQYAIEWLEEFKSHLNSNKL